MENYERLIQLFERMGGAGLRNSPIAELDLTFSQFAILACVGRMPESRVKEVAEKLTLTAPTVSVALKKMEEGGWIIRTSDPEDGRAVRVELSLKGIKVLKAMQEHRKSRIKRLLSALNKDEQGQLLSLLEKARTNIHSEKREDLNKINEGEN